MKIAVFRDAHNVVCRRNAMIIKDADKYSLDRIRFEIERGGRFVIYKYCFSIFIVSFEEKSKAYFLRKNERGFLKGFKYSIFSFFMGWWSFPHGPINTIFAISQNTRGGEDVTEKALHIIESVKSEAK